MGGFGLPFFVIGGLGVILGMVLLLLVPTVEQDSTESCDNSDNNNEINGEEREEDKPTMKLHHCIKVQMCNLLQFQFFFFSAIITVNELKVVVVVVVVVVATHSENLKFAERQRFRFELSITKLQSQQYSPHFQIWSLLTFSARTRVVEGKRVGVRV